MSSHPRAPSAQTHKQMGPGADAQDVTVNGSKVVSFARVHCPLLFLPMRFLKKNGSYKRSFSQPGFGWQTRRRGEVQNEPGLLASPFFPGLVRWQTEYRDRARHQRSTHTPLSSTQPQGGFRCRRGTAYRVVHGISPKAVHGISPKATRGMCLCASPPLVPNVQVLF